MVNSGAIMSSSILLHLVKKEMNMAQKYDYGLDFLFYIFSQSSQIFSHEKNWYKTDLETKAEQFTKLLFLNKPNQQFWQIVK